MNIIFVVLAVAAAVSAQHSSDPRQAAIVSEQRYLTGDGTFGTQYKQEDGIDFKEESDAMGNRKGSYSYVDATGQRRTVSYTAGKDGFMATGDHLPQPHVPHPQYTPDPKYNSPQYNEPEQYDQYDQQQQQQYQPAPQPKYQPQQQYQSAPQPQYKPQPQYQAPQQQYQPQTQYQQAPQQQYQPQTQYQQAPQQQYQPQYQPQQHTTTPAPHRFYPPGKLSLQRSPDGYAYSFNKS